MKEPDNDASDAEVFEWASGVTRKAIYDAAEKKLSGGSFEECMSAASAGLPTKTNVRIYLPDVREIGCVGEPLPRAFWHWVYRDRKGRRTIMLSWKMRLRLQTQGFVDIDAFTNEGLS